MRNLTHATSGACAAIGLSYVAQLEIGLPEVLVGTLAALLPNVDNLLFSFEKSKSPMLRRIAERSRIGGSTHAALILLPLATALGLALALTTHRWGMLSAVIAGATSHLVLDTFGKYGVQLWAPFSRAWFAWPPWEKLRPVRGGTVETIILVCSGLALIPLVAIPHLLPGAIAGLEFVANLLRGGR